MKKIATIILNSPVVKKIIGEELHARLGAETPTFFKKIQLVGLILGVVGGAVATAGVPAAIATVATVVATIGGTMVTFGQTAVVDPSVLPKKD